MRKVARSKDARIYVTLPGIHCSNEFGLNRDDVLLWNESMKQCAT
jgi:hypothetical protein